MMTFVALSSSLSESNLRMMNNTECRKDVYLFGNLASGQSYKHSTIVILLL